MEQIEKQMEVKIKTSMFDQVGILTSADPLSQLLPFRNLQES